MNRIDRLSAILIQLQSRSLVKAEQLAERFEISVRTVYRDIKALEEAGIPVIGSPGIGYSLVEGYKLPPLMFTKQEAIAFLTAEKIVSELADLSANRDYLSGMNKIRAVLRASEKDFLEDADKHIDVLSFAQSKDKADGMLQTIIGAATEKKALTMTYRTGTSYELSERTVEPLGVFFSKTQWYFTAFCRMREEYRTFKVGRIERATITDEDFTRKHPSFKSFLSQMSGRKDLHKVVLRMLKSSVARIKEDMTYHGFAETTEAGDEVQLTFFSHSLENFARWYLSFIDMATIVEPETLKDTVNRILSKGDSKNRLRAVLQLMVIFLFSATGVDFNSPLFDASSICF